MDYLEAIKYLESLPDMERGRKTPGNPTMSLNSMKNLLHIMGDPQDETKTIHITGSKGKGSTSTLIASMLQSAGYETALFTSPHLHSYRERIAFGLKPISENRFAQGVEQISEIIRKNGGEGIEGYSTFGILTALFFLLVRESSSKIDWQVVEVGLGGTTDATNVFKRKELAVITAISVEHAAILGKTPAEIAQHKGGIIIPGCSVILSEQKDAGVRTVIETICEKNKTALIEVQNVSKIKQIGHDLKSQSFQFEIGSKSNQFTLPFLGEHQLNNAATALVAIEELQKRGYPIDEKSQLEGLAGAHLAGRFEVFIKPTNHAGSLQAEQSAPFAFLLDGAHNEDSASALAVGVEQYFAPRKCILLLALNTDKDVLGFWRAIKPVCAAVVATRSDNPRSIPPEELISIIKDDAEGILLDTAESAERALNKAVDASSSEKIICVAGSLYLVAQIRSLLIEKHQAASHDQPLPSKRQNFR
jgi:dihydrofolate synthase/folylpolyglutamate synthase